MSTYPPPQENVPIFNPSNFETTLSSSVTQADLQNYVTLSTGQNVTGVKTFSAAPAISTITNTGTLTLPTSTGTLALVSQIPTNTTFVDLTTPQTITGVKTFSAAPAISTITNTGTLTLPTSTGTLALVSQIPTNTTFVDLTSPQTISGTKTFNSNPVMQSGAVLLNSGSGFCTLQFTGLTSPSLTLPTTSGSLVSTVGSYPAVVSQGLTLSNAQTISTASYLAGATINCASTTYTDAITAASGTVTQVADVLLGARTFTASNTAVTYTNAATLRIVGAPIAGTNITITTPNAILVDSGNMTLTNGRYLSASSGSATSPIFSIGGNGGIYSSAANTINIATGGTLRCSWSTATMTLAANYAITCSGTATITSGSGGFTSAGPVSSSLASSATACSVRPTNNANTGLFGTAATNVSVAVGGTAIVSCSTTGTALTGTLSTTGAATLASLKIGANGTTTTQALYGSATITFSSTANYGFVVTGVTFSNAFAVTPLVYLTNNSGDVFSGCTLAAGNITTSGMNIYATNTSGGTTSAVITVRYYAVA
jgi:hypothetical protein